MAHIVQFTQEPRAVHSHSYTPSSGSIRDLAFVGQRFWFEPDQEEEGTRFAVLTSDGTIDLIRIRAQTDVVRSFTGPAAVNQGSGIEFVGKDRFVFAYQLALATDGAMAIVKLTQASSYQLLGSVTVPFAGFKGATWNGRDGFFPFKRNLIPQINRVTWRRVGDLSQAPKNLINSDVSWGQAGADELRGITSNGRDFWVLFDEGGTPFLQLQRDKGLVGAAADFGQLSSTDISASLSGDARGLTFDGRHIYVGDDA